MNINNEFKSGAQGCFSSEDIENQLKALFRLLSSILRFRKNAKGGISISSVEIQQPLAVMDAAVTRCLDAWPMAIRNGEIGDNDPFLEEYIYTGRALVGREQITMGSVSYCLISHPTWPGPFEIGPFGALRIRQVTSNSTTVELYPPRQNYWETDEVYDSRCRIGLLFALLLLWDMWRGGHLSSGREKKKGGRPRNQQNHWAYEQVHTMKRQATEVYPQWLNMIGERARILADPYDSFKKAIRKR